MSFLGVESPNGRTQWKFPSICHRLPIIQYQSVSMDPMERELGKGEGEAQRRTHVSLMSYREGIFSWIRPACLLIFPLSNTLRKDREGRKVLRQSVLSWQLHSRHFRPRGVSSLPENNENLTLLIASHRAVFPFLFHLLLDTLNSPMTSFLLFLSRLCSVLVFHCFQCSLFRWKIEY